MDANTLWDFRVAPTEAGVLDELFNEMDRIIAEAGFISRLLLLSEKSPKVLM